RVMGIVAAGAWAEELIAQDAEAMPVPKSLDFAQAAAIPEAFLTAYDALFLQAGLKIGQWALVHAVGSGVGSAAVQLSRWAMAKVPLATILSKRLQVIGTTMRSRSAEEKAQVAQTFAERVLPGFESLALKPVIGAIKRFEELPKALEAMQANETFGKVVLTV